MFFRLTKNWAVALFGSPGARHGEGAALVEEAVVGLVDDRRLGGLLRHVRREAAALDHEIRDDAMEDGAVEETRLDVLEEVLHGLRGLVGVDLDGEIALVRLEQDMRIRVGRRGLLRLGSGGGPHDGEKAGETGETEVHAGFSLGINSGRDGTTESAA